jgi:putative flippase GtrA
MLRQLATRLRQPLAFAVIGVIGFGVDTAALYGAIAAGCGLYAGRVISFLCAVTATWALNRRYTFTDAAKTHWLNQWVRYTSSQTTGAVVNLGTYGILIHSYASVSGHPVLGVGAGSLCGLLVNYFAARWFAFREPSGTRS